MKLLLRILLAVSALGVLTVYFFSEMVLIEPAPRLLESSSEGPLAPVSNNVNIALVDQPASAGAGSSAAVSGSQASALRGITGSSAGLISSFKSRWQSLYSQWPVGKKVFRKGGKSSGPDSPLLRQRIGNLLTLVALAVGIAAISLAIHVVEEKSHT